MEFLMKPNPILLYLVFIGLTSSRISIESKCTLAKTANCKTEAAVTYVFVLFITGDICCTVIYTQKKSFMRIGM
jgi:hypothetical protein